MKNVEELQIKAARCRRLARDTTDRKTADILSAMADELEAKAAAALSVTMTKPIFGQS